MTKRLQIQKRSTPPINNLPAAKDVPPAERARLQGEADRVGLKNGYYSGWRLAQLCEMVSAARDQLLRDYLSSKVK